MKITEGGIENELLGKGFGNHWDELWKKAISFPALKIPKGQLGTQGEWSNSLYTMEKGLELLVGVSKRYTWENAGMHGDEKHKGGSCGECDWRERQGSGLAG